MKWVTVLAGACLCAQVCMGAIINVPSDQPTIQAGIDAAGDGDTVLVAPGVYHEYVAVDNNYELTLASNFLLSGDSNDIENTTIDADFANTAVSVSSYSATKAVRLSGFTIRHGFGLGDWPYVRAGGVHSKGDNITVEHCYIQFNLTSGDSNRGAGLLINSSNTLVRNCRIFGNASRWGTAITIGIQSSEVLVDSCEIFGNESTYFGQGSGVVMIGYSEDITISRTIVHHNTAGGIRNFGSTGIIISNCTVANNGTYGIYNTYFGTDALVTNSVSAFNGVANVVNDDNNGAQDCYLTTEYSDLVGESDEDWFGTGCIDTDPSFVDLTNFDYHLNYGSPCIDSGHPDSLDWDGTRVDMGALTFDQAVFGEAVIEPNPTYIYYKFAFLPIHATVFVGNFAGDFSASDVLDAEVEDVPATITGILPSYPGFEGEVLQLDIPIAPFLDCYGAPLDTTSQSFLVTGTSTDQMTIRAWGDVDLIGKSSASGGKQWILPPDEVVLHGDVDATGYIDIDDVTTIISAIFLGGSFFGPLMIADCNCSHTVDIDDIVYLVNYIFLGGNAAGDSDGDGVPDC